MFWCSVQRFSETYFTLRRTQQDVVESVYIGRLVTYPLFLSEFNELNFLDRFSKNTQISNFMKIRLLVAEFSKRIDGQTDGQA